MAFPNIRRGLVCAAILLNSLAAGGVFTFPLIAPALATHLKLTQVQLSTIVLGGLVGQYPLAALVGKVIDSPRGQNVCSGVAGLLLSLGFGLFSREVSKTPPEISEPSVPSFRLLTLLFFMSGLGTVFSCFSSMFVASKNFPRQSGLATGASMSLFGLSPLFLSLVATRYFTDARTGLNVSDYLRFLAMFAFATHLFGAMVLSTPSVISAADEDIESPNINEETPLIKTVHPVMVPEDLSSWELAQDSNFALLFCSSLLSLGACEMVMGNLGTILASLPPSGTASTDAATSVQVRLLSLSNTLSRLVVGGAADYLSPVPVLMPMGVYGFPRKHYVSRVAFLAIGNLLLALMFLWMAVGVKNQGAVWALSLGTGAGYGSIFVLLPTVIASIWGVPHAGRNFGLISYAPFVGTSVFSYIYAFGVSATKISVDGGTCFGVGCWRRTAWICCATSLVAFGSSLVLMRRWKGRL